MSASASRLFRRSLTASRRPFAPVLALTLLASGCQQASKVALPEPAAARTEAVATAPPPARTMPADMAQAAMVGGVARSPRPAQPAEVSRGTSIQPVDPVSFLAYAYTMALELPGERLPAVMDAHVAACRSAGPLVCQVVGAGRNGDLAGALRGSLSMRAEPAWLQRFMQGVPGDAAKADGRVTGQTTSTEDLTREIVDTEATLRAKKGLRDRLERLLANRPGDLSDLLSVERELARVQTEIDSTESNLAAMRTRVAMSTLTIEYASAARAVASNTFEPLRLALVNFLVAVVESTAALVTVVGGLLPWALVFAFLVWLGLRIRRRRDAREAAEATPDGAKA